MKAVVVGGGISGLTIAYRLLKAGLNVQILEQSEVLGGLARSVNLAGQTVDRHFHFFCESELDFRRMASEVGIADRLVWRRISRAVQLGGKIYPISTPMDVLRFTPLRFLDRLRFAANVLRGRHFASTRRLDKLTAEDWLKRSAGDVVYEAIWRPLLESKFGEHASCVSAAWLRARQKMQQENIAFIRGGSALVASTLAERVRRLGGEITLGVAATGVDLDGSAVAGVSTTAGQLSANIIVSTLPMPRLLSIAKGPLAEHLERFGGLEYIGVVNTVILVKRPISPYFWLNTNDANVSFAGIIDMTNLDPAGSDKPHVVYIPQYCPTDAELFEAPKQEIISRIVGDLVKVNDEFSDDWVLDAQVTKDCFTQHICTPGLLDRIPPCKTPVRGFFMTEWSQFYPNDRSVNNSIRIANACAAATLDFAARRSSF